MAFIRCGLSKEVPKDPVLSLVSHRVFERYLIEEYIDEHGTDPINGKPLTKDQLLEIIKNDDPQRITVRSMPQLLQVLQKEWVTANRKQEKLKINKSGKDDKGPLVDARVREVIIKSSMEAAFGDVQPWYEPWHIILEKLFPLSAGYLVSREFNALVGHMMLVVSQHLAGRDPRVVLLGGGTLPVLRHRDPGAKSMLTSCVEHVANHYMENGVAFQRVYWLGFMGPRCGWGWFEGGHTVNCVEGYWDLVQTQESEQRMRAMGADLRHYIDG